MTTENFLFFFTAFGRARTPTMHAKAIMHKTDIFFTLMIRPQYENDFHFYIIIFHFCQAEGNFHERPQFMS